MEDLTHAGDNVTMMQTINSLKKLLADARLGQSRWQVTFEVSVVQPVRDIKIVAKKLDGSGVIKTVSYQDVLYYKDDPSTLLQIIIEQMYVALIKQELINELGPKLTQAIRNCIG